MHPKGRAVLFSGPGKPFSISKYDLPESADEEIIIKNLYTTICGSDIHTYCGHRSEPDQVVLGHEIVGEIFSLVPGKSHFDFSGKPVEIGDRVIWSIFAVPEGTKPPREDMPQKSEQLFKYGHALATSKDIFNGGLADYCVLRPNTAFLKISAAMPLQVAATISCAHATVTGAIRVAGEIANQRVIIFGAGLLGISCAAMCREAGAARISLIDPDTSRLMWGEKFGADKTYTTEDFYTDQSQPAEEGDIVFDMTGHPAAMKAGLDALALGGTAVWIGAVFPAKHVEVDAQKIVRKLLQIKGLHNYNYDDFVNATSFIEHNYQKYPFQALIEKEYELGEVEEAFRYATQEKPVRVGIRI
ncbi:hypothetical protein TH53_07460 [Pedobacter lusitanus]|uniref:Alcohol dehydrogenase n=1 Tax=Pedobacter lusitanus TaxID=1503925 RepID=A0A0D0GTV8_9SPHI|nr:hypothetical protein TH53_07460 [Pedobacter lusitanus]